MNLKKIFHIDLTNYFVFLGAGLGGMYWFLQAFMDAYLFGQGNLTEHILSPDSHQIWMRTVVIFLMILSSFFVQSMLVRKKRAENILRQNGEIFRAAIESSINGLLVVDGRGQVIHTNSRFAELWGIPEEIMEEADDDKLIAFVLDQLQDPQAFLNKVQKLYRSADKDVDKLIFKDGRIFERYSYPLMVEGAVGGRVWSFADITQQEGNVSSLSLTQISVDHASDPVYWMGPDAQFKYVNKKAVKTLGYSQEEILQMTVHDIDPNFPVEAWSSHWKDLKERGSFIIESKHKKKDGTLIPVEISVNFICFEGQEYNCAYARDISARAKREEKYQQTIDELKEKIDKLESKLPTRTCS